MKVLTIFCLTLIMVSWTHFSPDAAGQSVRYTKHKKPMWGKHRLDWCLDWGKNCGKRAANAWCQAMGYEKGATRWTKANNIGRQSPTVVMRARKICKDQACDGFSEITCKKIVTGGGGGKADEFGEWWAVFKDSKNRCSVRPSKSYPSGSGVLDAYRSQEMAVSDLQEYIASGICR